MRGVLMLISEYLRKLSDSILRCYVFDFVALVSVSMGDRLRKALYFLATLPPRVDKSRVSRSWSR
jgi:hypothetical protein